MKKKYLIAGISLVAGIAAIGIGVKQLVRYMDKKVELYKKCWNVTCQWICLKQDGVSLEKFFHEKGYRSIAIYGMGRMGGMLYEELKNSDIEVKYGIDRSPYCTYPGLDIIEPEDKLQKVDVIVVTPMMIFDEIKELLSEKTNIPIIHISEVLYDC